MFTKNNRSALVMTAFLGLLTASVGLVTQSAVAAEKETVSIKVGKPLQDAISAAQAKKFDDALAKLRDADSVAEKTAFDQFKINQVYQWIYISQKKYADAASVTEKLLDSGMLSAAEADANTKNLVQMHFQVKNYTKAQDAIQRWLKLHPNDVDMQASLGLLQNQTGAVKQAYETLSSVVSGAEKAGSVPKEDWLLGLYQASYKLNGNSAADKHVVSVMEKLVRYYPKDAYWHDLLVGIKGQLTADAPKLQLYRLMLAVGLLKNPNDYVEMAQLAKNFGYPSEALSALDAGYAKNILGQGGEKDRHDRLRANVQQAVTQDKASLPALEKAAAKNMASGQEDANLGENYLGYGMNNEAITALERGLGKGNLKRPDQAQIALGIAYLRAGQGDKARSAFKQVTGDSELARLASLWSLYTLSKK